MTKYYAFALQNTYRNSDILGVSWIDDEHIYETVEEAARAAETFLGEWEADEGEQAVIFKVKPVKTVKRILRTVCEDFEE